VFGDLPRWVGTGQASDLFNKFLLMSVYNFFSVAIFIILFVSCNHQPTDPLTTSVDFDDFEREILENHPQWQWLRQEFAKNQMLFDSLEFYENSQNQLKLASVKIDLADRFRESGNYDGGLEFLNEIYYDVYKKGIIPFPDSIKRKIFHGLASIYFELFFHNNTETNYLDSAAWYSDQFYKLSASDKTNPQTLLTALNLKGAVLLHQGKNQQALNYLEEGFRMYRQDNTLFVLALLMNLGHTHHRLGDFEQAMEVADLAHDLAQTNKHPVFLGMALNLKSVVFDSKGDSLNARRMRQEFQLLDQRKDVYMNELLAQQQMLNYYRNKDQKTIMGLYNDQFFLFRLSRILIIGIVLMIIIAATAIYLYRQNKNLMSAQLAVIQSKQQNDQLRIENTQLEIEKQQMREKALVDEINTQKSTIAAKIITLTKLNEFLSKIVSDIKTLNKKGSEQDKAHILKRLEKNISSHIDNSLWNEFDLLISEANNEFLKRLLVDHPDLTITEKRLAFLIVMNFTIKETSEIMAKNYRSVEMARYRLRLKLGLDKNENLTAYLNQYSQKENSV
jgi:DNA-binding CsgD family transcriptional regulator/cell division protein FtsL